MRAGGWLTLRDLAAARASWRHARDVADRLPDNDPGRTAMRIAPRTLLCASAWLAGGTMADTGFDELRELASAAGDKVSLAMGTAGCLPALIVHARFSEASELASELADLLESIGDPTLIVGLLYGAISAKLQCGEITEAVRLAQRVIDLADGDATMGNFIIGSPLVAAIMLRGSARSSLGDRGWTADVEQATTMVRAFNPTLRALMLFFKVLLIPNGIRVPESADLRDTAEVLELAERSGDNFTLACARCTRGIVLLADDGAQRDDAIPLLAATREAALEEHFTLLVATWVDLIFAIEKARTGDLDGAIELARPAVEFEYACGDTIFLAWATAALVQILLRRVGQSDLQEAQSAIERLAAVPTEPGFVLHDIWLLRMRALLAQARGDEAAYRDYRDRYREMANSLGFEGHIKWAEEMA
jgi:adenylate cyclase